MAIDPRFYRRVMGRLATGVCVLTTPRPGTQDHEVITANSVMSVSLEPALLAACTSAQSRWRLAVRATSRFAVNVLSADQEHLSRWCAKPERHLVPEALSRNTSHVSANGLLLFDDALAGFECEVYAEYPAGDHDLVLGEVVDMRLGKLTQPLIFFDSGYASVTPPLVNEYPELWHQPRLALRD